MQPKPHTEASFQELLAAVTDLHMKGKIRSRQRCPVHGCTFQGHPLICPRPRCKRAPAGGFFLEVWHDGAQRKIYSTKDGTTLDSWSLASKLLTRINVEIADRRFDPDAYNQNRRRRPGAYTFGAYAQKVLEDKASGAEHEQNAARTIELYRMYLKRHLEPEIGAEDIREINLRRLKDLRQTLLEKPAHRGQGRTLSPKYVRNLLAFVREILAQAVEDQMLPTAPRAPKIRLKKRKYKILQQPQQLAALAQVDEWHKPIFWCAYYTGQRPGELASTKIRDYDRPRRQLKLRDRKAGDEHVIPLPDELCAMLDNMLAARFGSNIAPHPDQLLFTMPAVGGTDGGQPYNTNNLPRMWRRYCAAAGVPYIGLYASTKHSLAHRMLELGYSRSAIAAFLGITEKSTENYAEFSAELLRPISEKLHPKTTRTLDAGTKRKR